MRSKAQYYSKGKLLRIILSFVFVSQFGCSTESCNGGIESIVLLSKSEPIFGGERIYVDVKNRGGIGVRKTLKCGNGIVGTFDNVVIVRDFRSRFKDRRKICFNEFYKMQPTDGARMNDEETPEIQLYR